jgi:hypothetical protein
MYRYELNPRDDSPIIEAFLRLADRYLVTAAFAILRRQDGFTTFFQGLP